jgi:hypothetical protein
MPAKLGILVVHGMGSQKDPHFADNMIDEVNGRVKDLDLNPHDVAWQPLYWADLLEPQENELWSKLSKHNTLGFESLRKFVLSNLADAVAYQREPDSPPDVYQRIHARVHEGVVSLRVKLGDQDAPLLVMAHSLGSYVMSNYIWDQQRQNSAAIPSLTEFEKMRTLCTLITFGCNIALFSLALSHYVGITFPPQELKPPLRSAARWLNFFDPQDILGYPVKPLWDGYANNPQIEDREINVGNIFTSWNPLSHDQYWTDNDFTEPVAQHIASLLKVLG